MITVRSSRLSNIARLGLLMLGLWTTIVGSGTLCWGAAAAKPPADDAAKDDSGDLETRLKAKIDDDRVTPTLTTLGKKTLVTLRGDVETDQENAALLVRAHKALTKAEEKTVEIWDRIFVKLPGPPKEPKKPEKTETDLWVLTYIHSEVHSTAPASTPDASTTPDPIDTLVDVLNSIYPSDGAPVVQRAGLGRLLLTGPRSKVLEVQHFLALIDAPLPQVQLNMWAIQVSGAPKDISPTLHAIGKEVRAARDRMAAVQQELARIVVLSNPEEMGHWQDLKQRFEAAGIDLPQDGSLSLNESLIFLTLDPQRQQKVKNLQDYVRRQCSEAAKEMGQAKGRAKASPQVVSLGCQDPVPFHHLADLFAAGSYADRQSFIHFGEALYCFRDRKKMFVRPDAPRNLVRTGATVDRVLKSVMDAFSADMNDLFLDPLLERIQALGGGGRGNEGVALVGRTRIVVTSGLEAGLEPAMASFVESGRPKPFGKDLLDAAFPSSKAGESTKKDVLTGTSQVLAGLSNAQAIGLAALLASDIQPAYTKVAPGIAVNVRPTVLPDGGAARLTVDARFGVTSTPLEESRQDIWRQAPPAGIVSHDVRTDAVVSAFDLFDISSFSVEASHPQTPIYVPILGRLPIIGPAFQFPRHNKTTHFESLVLVNTVILPRSIELHRFYGLESPPKEEEKEKIKCREDPPSTPRLNGLAAGGDS